MWLKYPSESEKIGNYAGVPRKSIGKSFTEFLSAPEQVSRLAQHSTYFLQAADSLQKCFLFFLLQWDASSANYNFYDRKDWSETDE